MNYPPDNNQNNADADMGDEANNGGNFALENNSENDIIYDNNINNRAEKNKDVSPRLVFVILAFLGFGTLIFGFVSLANNIRSPFYTAPETGITSENSSSDNQSISATEILALKNTDTDGDGLSDYDETYVYKTSPYISDTDSDGYSDKEEIDSKHDPLCPAGRDCAGLENSATDASKEDQQIELPPGAEDLNQEPIPPDENLETTELTQEQKDELKKLTPAQIRQLLIESGKLTEEQLSQIDDEQLMQIFLESIK
jgi:hypothetical protein